MNDNNEISIEEGSTNVYADLGYANAAKIKLQFASSKYYKNRSTLGIFDAGYSPS
jgi:hypothetical protein